MSDQPNWGGTIRKLWPTERDKLQDHLLRLDPESRRLRFAHAVSTSFIMDYVARIPVMNSIMYAYIESGEVRAMAELRPLDAYWSEHAEAAFSVEADWQNRGIGTELMGYVIRSAKNRGVKHLLMSCMVDNKKIQKIALKHNALITFEQGDVIGMIAPDDATYFTQIDERISDRIDIMIAVLQVDKPITKVA